MMRKLSLSSCPCESEVSVGPHQSGHRQPTPEENGISNKTPAHEPEDGLLLQNMRCLTLLDPLRFGTLTERLGRISRRATERPEEILPSLSKHTRMAATALS